MVEWSDTTILPFLLCIHDRIYFRPDFPAQLSQRIGYAVIIIGYQPVFVKNNQDIPVRVLSGIATGLRPVEQSCSTVWQTNGKHPFYVF